MKSRKSTEIQQRVQVCRAATEADREEWIAEINRGSIVTVFEAPLATAVRVNPNRPGTYIPLPVFLVKALRYLEDG